MLPNDTAAADFIRRWEGRHDPEILERSQHGRPLHGRAIVGVNTAKVINQLRDNPGMPVCQRNYYERVIRDEQELDANRQYIVGNPANGPKTKTV
jgi:hypothetical protein